MSNRPVFDLRANGANGASARFGPSVSRTVRAVGLLLLLGALLAVSHMFLARAVGALISDSIARFAEPEGCAAIAIENASANGTIANCAAEDGTAARPADWGPRRDLLPSPSITADEGRAALAACVKSMPQEGPDRRRLRFFDRIEFRLFSAFRTCPGHGSFGR